MIKLVASDLDGTLLTPERTLSERTIQAVEGIRKKGVLFTFCTGRMYHSARKYVQQLGLTTPVIAYNGAMIIDPISEQVLFHRPLENDVAVEILQMAQELSFYSQIYIDDTLYCREFTSESEGYAKNTGTFAEETDCELWKCLGDKKTTKIIVMMDKERAATLLKPMREQFAGRAEVTISEPEYMEFLHPAVNKGAALERLAKELAIAREEILAFGDSYNDLPLLHYAGMGVAVENACLALRTEADEICPANGQDGEAQYLERLFDL